MPCSGVTLYGETDYRGALVEFKRAYELAPNAAVLYNIGETEFQLRDYAGALTTFERYLADAQPSDSHRTEVEANVRELKARVGRLTITTVPRGADVSIDDRALGKGFENPVVVATDLGASKRARNLAERLGYPLAVMEKRRLGNDDTAEVVTVIGEVNGMTALIESIRAEYLRYKALAEAAIAQLTDAQLCETESSTQNSIELPSRIGSAEDGSVVGPVVGRVVPVPPTAEVAWTLSKSHRYSPVTKVLLSAGG